MTPRTFKALVIVMMTPPMVWVGILLAHWLSGAALVVGLALYSAAALSLVAYAVWLAAGERHQRVQKAPHGAVR